MEAFGTGAKASDCCLGDSEPQGETGVPLTQRFKQPLIGLKGAFPLITFANANIVVPPANIQLGEVLGLMKLIDELWNEGYGVVIFDCHCVQCSGVLHQLKGAVLLLNEEYQGCHWRLRWVDMPQAEVLLKEGIEFSLFIW